MVPVPISDRNLAFIHELGVGWLSGRRHDQ
jgi:hypothetical protein